MPTLEECLTVEEAAAKLDVSTKTVRRLIAQHILNASLLMHRSRKRMMIPKFELVRYRLSDWLENAMADFVLSDGPGTDPTFGNFGGSTFVFGRKDRRALPPVPKEIEVSFGDLWRYAYGPRTEAVTDELRELGGFGPGPFAVVFRLSLAEVFATLQKIVASVKVPEIRGCEIEELKLDALKHLIWSLPALRSVRSNPKKYLKRAVRNFYADKIRQASQRYKRLLNRDFEEAEAHTGEETVPEDDDGSAFGQAIDLAESRELGSDSENDDL